MARGKKHSGFMVKGTSAKAAHKGGKKRGHKRGAKKHSKR